jgi:hypothetical protein
VADTRKPKRSDDEETTQVMSMPPQSLTPVLGSVDASGGVEVVVVRERMLPRAKRGPWRAFEVWTKNRIYGVDTALRCTVVLDRRTGQVDAESTVGGLRLGGGRLRSGGITRVSYPFPLVGMEATFTDGRKQVYTSRVERFVVRIRDVQTKGENEPQTWEEIIQGME